MEILSAIVQLLGGLALFLYGIELMGDGLKNSSGAALKRVLEKVTGNVVMGVLTGALVTAVIQSSTATIVLTVALIGAGVLNLRQAVSIVMGANIGTTVTAQIIRLGSIQSDGSWLLWLFDTDTLAPIALIIGIVLLMFIKSKRSNTIGDICIGFGILFWMVWWWITTAVDIKLTCLVPIFVVCVYSYMPLGKVLEAYVHKEAVLIFGATAITSAWVRWGFAKRLALNFLMRVSGHRPRPGVLWFAGEA